MTNLFLTSFSINEQPSCDMVTLSQISHIYFYEPLTAPLLAMIR